MATTSLDQVQDLVDQLTPLEQVRLLEYLVPRIARVVAARHQPTLDATRVNTEAWAEFFRIGDALATSDPGDGATLTASVLAMRR